MMNAPEGPIVDSVNPGREDICGAGLTLGPFFAALFGLLLGLLGLLPGLLEPSFFAIFAARVVVPAPSAALLVPDVSGQC